VLVRERNAKDFAEAVQRYRAGRLAEAERLCRQLLARAPGHAQALHLLGTIALQTGRPADAVAPLASALAQQPRDGAIHNLLGTAYLQLERHAEAVDSLRTSIGLDPGRAEAHCALGVALAALNQSDEAIAAFRASLDLDPDMPQAHFNLAGLFAARQRGPEAIAHYREVLRLEPDNAVAHHQIGRGLSGQGDSDAALRHFREAVRLQPSYIEARHNIGLALAFAGRWREALAEFETTLRVEPESGEAHYNLGSILLLQGLLERGWEQFEWRWNLEGMRPFRRPFLQPQWRGEDIAGQTLILHDEQGFGDTLHFCRYAPLAARRCAKVYLEVHVELVELLRQSFAGDGLEILPRTPSFPGIEGLPECDYQSPLLSLPNVFETGLDTIPAEIPYLRADPEAERKWTERLAFLPHPRVGLIWGGRPGHAQDALRSVALAQLAPLGQIPGVTFLSLQKGEAASQLAEPPPGMTIHDFTAELPNFADTAAFLAAVDLVVTVDTAMAHLSGALGKPVWMLNRCLPDWRWLLERDDSPWYPTLRQFRQPRHGDWDSAVAALAAALESWVGTYRAGPVPGADAG
jgi:tetratricopeptide (TPR) repeat protein